MAVPLGPAVAAFDGQIDARVLGGPDAAEAVRTGVVDLAVGVWDLVPRGVEALDLVQTPLCAALRADHPLAAREAVPLQALATERLIVAPAGQRHRDVVGRAIASLGASPLPPVEADGWPLMLAFAAAGLGIGVVNGTCRPPEGVVLRPIPELGTVTYRVLQRRDAPPSAARDRLLGCLTRAPVASRP